LNAAIQRSFSLHDRLELVFRAEAFKVLNHVNAGAIDPGLFDGPSFGQPQEIDKLASKSALRKRRTTLIAAHAEVVILTLTRFRLQ
jgi:hypothetical protein